MTSCTSCTLAISKGVLGARSKRGSCTFGISNCDWCFLVIGNRPFQVQKLGIKVQKLGIRFRPKAKLDFFKSQSASPRGNPSRSHPMFVLKFPHLYLHIIFKIRAKNPLQFVIFFCTSCKKKSRVVPKKN